MLGGGEFLPSNFIMDILADLVCDQTILQVGTINFFEQCIINFKDDLSIQLTYSIF